MEGIKLFILMIIAACDSQSIKLWSIADCDTDGLVHVITEKRIWEAKEKWPRAANALDAWYRLIKRSHPADFAQLKSMFPAVDKVGSVYVFDIGGNKIRLIAAVHYSSQTLFIKGVLDHVEYDKARWRITS